MCADLLPLSRVALPQDDERIVTVHRGQTISHRRFCAEVAGLSTMFERQPQRHYAIYYESAYPFAVTLFALWHAGKQVWIAGNNRPVTAETLLQQDCRLLGEWSGQAVLEGTDGKYAGIGYANVETTAHSQTILESLDLQRTRLTIFTSGSGGETKAIAKTLLQLQREVDVLEAQWGIMLGRASAVATVSHQHIYGLLFRLLWPLAGGRPFYSEMYLSPEPMLNAVATEEAYWVASPAQLKRLDERSEWEKIASLKAIFSSGGALAIEATQAIEDSSGLQVVEVYGSSETGGIGWRNASIDVRWTPFMGVTLSLDQSGRCRLDSPLLPQPAEDCLLDDRVELYDDGCFRLAGRLDRIVKVEEKRLSLDELERVLKQSGWIEQVYTLLLPNRRDRVAAVIVLNENGKVRYRQQGRQRLIKALKKQLMRSFEAVVLPRKWLLTESLPLTPQGKIDRELLLQLLTQNKEKLPRLLYCCHEANTLRLDLWVSGKLIYFDGHFPEQPILPGVAQLAWVEHYGKLFFAIDRPFLTMEVIKFKKIIQPEMSVILQLEWKAETGKLYFELNSAADSHSSGRMVYGER